MPSHGPGGCLLSCRISAATRAGSTIPRSAAERSLLTAPTASSKPPLIVCVGCLSSPALERSTRVFSGLPAGAHDAQLPRYSLSVVPTLFECSAGKRSATGPDRARGEHGISRSCRSAGIRFECRSVTDIGRREHAISRSAGQWVPGSNGGQSQVSSKALWQPDSPCAWQSSSIATRNTPHSVHSSKCRAAFMFARHLSQRPSAAACVTV